MAKTITGVVASKKTDKTIVVAEHVRLTHPLYRKQYTMNKRFMAHDEKNEAQEGDKVVIVECRPLSARKHFRLERVVEKAGVKHVENESPLDELTDKKADEPKAAKSAKEAKATEQEA
jgi:small subunit ribosomal protein S17